MSSELLRLVNEKSLPEMKKMGDFLEFVNSQPPKEWLERTPDGKANTMPIGRVEALLTYLFQEWRVEVISTDTMFNSIVSTVRLHYKHPVDGEWKWQDGVGAVPAKTLKGAKASDMTAILNDAVQTGLPASVSFAIKDAADRIGRLFGRDINRKGNYAYQNQYQEQSDTDWEFEINNAESVDDLMQIFNKMTAAEKKLFTESLSIKKKELANDSANK